MRVIVLGAGVVGVTTAWYLAADGHEVTVFDREAAPAMGASHANGGQISVSHAEPWAGPRAPGAILRWLGRDDAPLLWHMRADAAQWQWGLRFLAECRPARVQANVAALIRLGLYSRTALGALRNALGLAYDQQTRGILHIYSDAIEYDHALQQAERMRALGCERIPRSAAECIAMEPALARFGDKLVGGTYTAADESGDARAFTEALTAKARVAGVRFRFGETVSSLQRGDARVTGLVLTSGEQIAADATVLAAGCWSPLLLAPLGLKLPVIPAKGYSATYHLDGLDAAAAPWTSLTDDGHKLVFSRLGQRLRVAGTAEFAGYDASLNAKRCAMIRQRTEAIFPALKQAPAVDFWAGLRPSTPSNVPYVCGMKHRGLDGLWLNTGHGTLGWTLACGSARLLADQLAGRAAEVDPAPYRY